MEDNTVAPVGNARPSASKERPYHHGDLRAALVRAGLELLARRAVDDISLREIARSVGVSANAVYRHFPDKEALMQALASEGLHRLADRQNAAARMSGGGADAFAATGCAYVQFAVDNPALFRLMFSSPARGGSARTPGPEGEAVLLLRENAAAAARPGEDEEVVALRAWSLAHGLAMLVVEGQVVPGGEMIAAVFNAATITPVNGLEKSRRSTAIKLDNRKSVL